MSEMEWTRIGMLLMPGALFLWPYFFIRLQRGQHKLVFVCASFGLPLTFALLFPYVFAPLYVFAVYLVPQLVVDGLGVHLVWLVALIEILWELGDIVIGPLFLIALAVAPPLMYRRYPIFHAVTKDELKREDAD